MILRDTIDQGLIEVLFHESMTIKSIKIKCDKNSLRFLQQAEIYKKCRILFMDGKKKYFDEFCVIKSPVVCPQGHLQYKKILKIDFITEIIWTLKMNGYCENDISRIGIREKGYLDWEELKKIKGKFLYHNSKPPVVINPGLIIVMKNGENFKREKFGCPEREFWVCRRPFTLPDKKLELYDICSDEPAVFSRDVDGEFAAMLMGNTGKVG